jgi:hypothetical protein
MITLFLCTLAYLFGALSALVLIGLLSVTKNKQR